MNIAIAPDSFKGTLSAAEAAGIIGERFAAHFPGAAILLRPLADGGEGTVDCFAAAGGEKFSVETRNGWGDKIAADYCVLKNGTAVFEIASVAGYTADGRRDPSACTTFGLGALVRDAIKKGCAELDIGLGGSASNDGGTGLAAALGVKFFKADGTEFIPVGKTLCEIADFDASAAKSLLAGRSVTGLCDVNNPFYGPNGAARVYAPQKGADEKMVGELDGNMRMLAELVLKKTGVDLQKMPGSGAAGGVGGGLAAFLGGGLRSGIDELLRLFPIENTDLIITGEGCVDAQTASGKTVAGVLKAAGKTPVVAIGGLVKTESALMYKQGIKAIVGVNRVPADFELVKKTARDDLAAAADAAARLIALGQILK